MQNASPVRCCCALPARPRCCGSGRCCRAAPRCAPAAGGARCSAAARTSPAAGAGLGVGFSAEGEHAPAQRLAARQQQVVPDAHIGHANAKLRTKDWQLLRALILQPRRALAESPITCMCWPAQTGCMRSAPRSRGGSHGPQTVPRPPHHRAASLSPGCLQLKQFLSPVCVHAIGPHLYLAQIPLNDQYS